MSKKKAKEVCRNLYLTITKMKTRTVIHNDEMFNDKSTRVEKNVLKRIYNKLIKKYDFRRRLL
jgi:hypothetical protein